MTMYGLPVVGSMPVSRTCTTCAESIEPLARASRWKRAITPSSLASAEERITFSATRRFVPRWTASYTAPMPPAPS